MAISDISLTAGMRNNLLGLQKTASQLSQTQERLGSGKRSTPPSTTRPTSLQHRQQPTAPATWVTVKTV